MILRYSEAWKDSKGLERFPKIHKQLEKFGKIWKGFERF